PSMEGRKTMSTLLRRLATTTAAVVLAVAGGAAGAAAADTAAGTTIAVDRAHPFGALPRDFVGLSYEMRELSALCTTGDCTGNFDARQGNLTALYHNLGRSNVRIAGNQLDRDTLWVPAGQQPPNPLPSWVADVVTPADIARLNGVLRATGWKAEVGINLAHFDPALATDEAHALQSILGPRLAGAECGNEPNHYASNGYRPAPYGLADVTPQLNSAKAVGVPIRLDETNSAVGGGIAGVSDVYASALWALDYNLTLAQAGFAGLNFHGGFGVCGAPLFNGKFQRYTPI